MTIRDYFILPEHVQAVDFVHQLDSMASDDARKQTLETRDR